MAEPSSSNSSYDSSGSDDEVSLKDVMRLYTLGEIVPKDTDRLVINESLLLPEALKVRVNFASPRYILLFLHLPISCSHKVLSL